MKNYKKTRFTDLRADGSLLVGLVCREEEGMDRGGGVSRGWGGGGGRDRGGGEWVGRGKF